MNGNRVHGVQFIDGKGSTKHVLARKDVVLSAGSIKSPQILQLSGIGPSHVLEPLDVSKFKFDLPDLFFKKDKLKYNICVIDFEQIPVVADLPVGDNLQDHLQVPLFVELVNSSVSVNVAKVLRPTQLWNYFVHQKGKRISQTHTKSPGGTCILRFKLTKSTNLFTDRYHRYVGYRSDCHVPRFQLDDGSGWDAHSLQYGLHRRGHLQQSGQHPHRGLPSLVPKER